MLSSPSLKTAATQKNGGGKTCRVLALERLKKNCSRSERGFLGLASGADHRPLAKEQVPSNPVTEPKRSQNPKRPPPLLSHPNGCSFSENALGCGSSARGTA